MNYVNSRTTLGLIMSVTAKTPWDPNSHMWSNRSVSQGLIDPNLYLRSNRNKILISIINLYLSPN